MYHYSKLFVLILTVVQEGKG